MKNKAGVFDDVAWTLCQVWKTEGRSFRWMADNLPTKVTHRTVSYNLSKPIPSSRRAAAPPKVRAAHAATMKKRRLIVRTLVSEELPGTGGKKKYPSAPLLARKINADTPITTSASTVRRDLRHMGAVSRKRVRGPKRLRGDAGVRKQRCLEYLKMTKAQMLSLKFSDEKYWDSQDHGGERVWCFGNEQPRRQQRDVWSPRIHVWGVIGMNYRMLVRIPNGRQNGDQYKKKCVEPFARDVIQRGILNSTIFQYDGDKSHGTSNVKVYLERKGVEVLPEWPPRSPDLTPIENMWGICQREVDRRVSPDATPDEMWEVVRSTFDAIPVAVVNNLILSVPWRLKECIGMKGETITTKRKRS